MTIISPDTLRVIAAECGQSELYSVIESIPADVSAAKDYATVAGGSQAFAVQRFRHSDYKKIYSEGALFTNEADQLAFCKKVIQHVRAGRRAHKHHHHH